jgi:hypothetical protein
MKTFLVAAVALSAIAATPALARNSHERAAADQAYATQSSAPVTADESDLTAKGPAVISFDQYRGWDPDQNIRFQLLRDPNLAP